jgi:hypothetical protein
MKFTIPLIYTTHRDAEDLQAGMIDFWRCIILEEPQGKTCVSASSVREMIFNLTCQSVFFTAISVILVVFSAVSVPARAVWAKHIDQIRGIFRRMMCKDTDS